MRVAVAAVLAAALLPLSLVASAAPAQAVRAMPGDFTGYAFDTCDAPSGSAMRAWRKHSRFWAVGVYVAGINRACAAQPHLTRGWVRAQARGGWRILPLVVGRQASCSPQGYYTGRRISPDPRARYAEARAQGRRAAAGGVGAARRLGIGRGSVLWFDLEHFDLGRDRCRRSAMWFTSAWTTRLHQLGYRSGFYSSASSGIAMVDSARRHTPRLYERPDYLWIAEWNGRDSLRSSYISRQGWWPHRRVHQYRGGHTERHGGVAINIDSNFLSTGRGTRPGRPAPHCRVNLSFRAYDAVQRGDRGPRVSAGQCLLRQRGRYDGEPHGRFTRRTAAAVREFQRRNSLQVTGRLGRPTWTALLSSGSTPLLKLGAGGDGVRRFQRALNASTDARLPVDGVFSRADAAAVRGLQRRVRHDRTGVVTDRTWRVLRHGRVVGGLPPRRSDVTGLLEGIWAGIPFSSGATPR